jgi:hypothetical protein
MDGVEAGENDPRKVLEQLLVEVRGAKLLNG